MEKKTFNVYDIQWDTDGDKELLAELPSTMEIEITEDDVDYLDDTDEIESYIEDYLSDEVGYCHFGFQYDEIKK